MNLLLLLSSEQKPPEQESHFNLIILPNGTIQMILQKNLVRFQLFLSICEDQTVENKHFTFKLIILEIFYR